MHVQQLQQRPLPTPRQSNVLTSLPRRVRRGPTQREQCVAGAGFVVGGASSSNLQTLSHLVSAVSLAIGAWWVSSELLREEVRSLMDQTETVVATTWNKRMRCSVCLASYYCSRVLDVCVTATITGAGGR